MMEALPEERIVTEQDSEQCGFNARVCAAMVGHITTMSWECYGGRVWCIAANGWSSLYGMQCGVL